MATIVTRYVNPGAAAGGDGTTPALTGANCAYQSLNACITARVRNLVAADEIEQIYCDSNGPADTTSVDITGWTTDATRYIIIRTPSTYITPEWKTDRYRLEIACSGSTTYNAIRLSSANQKVVIAGLAIGFTGTRTGGEANCIQAYASGSTLVLANLLFWNTSTYAQVSRGLYVIHGTAKISNSFAYNMGHVGFLATVNADAVIQANNCQSYNSLNGFRVGSAGSITCKNCVADGGTGFSTAGGTISVDYCSSSDTTATTLGTNSRGSQDPVYVNEAGLNFCLSKADTSSIGFGTNLSAGDPAVTTDSRGVARNSPYSMGSTLPFGISSLFLM